MIRVGVVGLGAMGQHHARVYSQLNCILAGVADANLEQARMVGDRYSVPYYTDYRRLLSRISAVSIAVPTTLHKDIAIEFIQAGIHCLVEKPISRDLEEAEAMIEAARINKVNLAIGHIERFNPAVLKLKQAIDSGKLGQVLIISTRRAGPFMSRIRDVGIVIDSATHDIGVVRYLVGREPSSVFARSGSFRNGKEDYAIFVLDFRETIASIEVNWFTPQKVRTLVATGSEGVAYLDYIEQKLTICNSHGKEDVEVLKREPLQLELEDFLNCITQCRPPATDGYEGRRILKIALEGCRREILSTNI